LKKNKWKKRGWKLEKKKSNFGKKTEKEKEKREKLEKKKEKKRDKKKIQHGLRL